MSLHNDYATLLRRGMPEHERLSWATECVTRPCFVLTGIDGDSYAECHDDDARAIITMHALEWALERDYSGDFGLFLSGLFTNRTEPTRTIMGQLLPGIMACTAHMEPA